MTFDKKTYDRNWRRKDRRVKAWRKTILKNHCPVCSMLLSSKYHVDCPFFSMIDKTTPL